MGCKASAVRGGASESHDTRATPPGATPSPSTSQLRTPHDPKRSRSADLPGRQPRISLKGSKPNSPVRDSCHDGDDGRRATAAYVCTQDDDPFAPPPPLPPELADPQGDDAASSRSSSPDGNAADCGELLGHPSDSAFPRLTSDPDSDPEAMLRRRQQRPENHFDPVPLPAVLLLQDSTNAVGARGIGGGPLNGGLPSRPSSMIVTLDSEDHNATFRTDIEAHDKTDSAQAALEYQQRVHAKRTAVQARTTQRQLDDCDPVRPVDSFNVTHRGLLGRCWDRRTPELIPVSFVHAMESALRTTDESHPTSTTTSHPAGGLTGRDEYPPCTPHVSASRLSHTSGCPSGVGASSAPPSGRRVPRRSHWFSLAGVSSDAVATHLGSIPSAGVFSPYYLSSNVSTPVVAWPGGGGASAGPAVFPVASPAPTPAASRSAPPSVLRGAGGRSGNAGTAASSPVRGGAGADFLAHTTNDLSGTLAAPSDSDQEDGALRWPITLEQIAALSLEKREHYFNHFLCHNPRYTGIRDAFGFRLANGVGDEPSTKFLRKRNLGPAPGVVAMRWNRVELFHPTLHTLIRAVAMTQGVSLGSSQHEGSQPHAGTPRSRWASTNHMAHGSSVAVDSNDAANTAAEGPSPRRSLSQYVMGHLENRSFTRSIVDGSPNGSFMVNTDRGHGGGGGGGNGTRESSASRSNNSIFSLPHGSATAPAAGEAGYVAAAKFPEDSVLALALCIPSARLPQLTSGSAVFGPQAGAGRLRSGAASAASPTNSREHELYTLHSPNRPTASTVLVALTVSSFSVSIDPFRWQENRYTRYPVDMDGSKRSARQAYGEGVVTDIMYGGVMVVECSSPAAVKELQTLLACMPWTEGRTLSAVIGEVRKHFKQIQSKARSVAPASSVASASAAGGSEVPHRYRVWRRIGGRPMRDAVELEEISYFLGGDEPREAAAPLIGASGSNNINATAPIPTTAADPEASPSYSRVASVWVGMPVIAAVLRTWGLHLLSYPEYAQPISMFLQRYCGVAPVLLPTALSSFYHVGNTPMEESEDEVDYLFFEGDGADTASQQRPALGGDANSRNASRVALDASRPDSPAAQGRGRGGPPRFGTQLSDGASEGIGPKSHSKETMEGDTLHLVDSMCSGPTAPDLISPAASHGAGGGSGGAWCPSAGVSTVASPNNEHDTTAGDSSRRHRRGLPHLGGRGGHAHGTNGVAGRSKGMRLSGSSRVHPSRVLSGSLCATPLSPDCGTRPQSRLHDRDADRSSASSSSSSLPSLPAVQQHSTTVFQPTSYSAAATQPNTPGLPATDSQHNNFLARARRRTIDGDASPPSHFSMRSLELPPTDDGPATPETLPGSTAPGGTPAVQRSEKATFRSPTSPNVKRWDSCSIDGSLSLNDTRDTVGPRASTPPSSPSVPAAAATAPAAAAAAAPGPPPTAPPKRKITKTKKTKKAAATTTTTSAAVAPSAPAALTASAGAAAPPPLPPRLPPTAAADATPSHTSQSSSPLSTVLVAAAAAAAASGKRKRPGPNGARRPPGSPKYLPPSLPDAASPFAQLRSRSSSLLGSGGGVSGGVAGVAGSPCSPSILLSSSTLPSTTQARDEEQEGLWYMAMLEVRARRQELEELRHARRDAEDLRERKENELRALNRLLLPHTTSQELDGVLLYLKTALHAPEDLPHGRLFLPHSDWVPMLAAVWTSPANRIRTVEVATELTWVDIPRLGLVTGLLHHQHAAPPLEELVLRADKLLGATEADAQRTLAAGADSSPHDDDNNGAALAERPRRLPVGRHRLLKPKRGKSRGGREERSSDSLHFTTELDQVINAFGAGCPPFIITPEEARDTLWLLLCAVAANAATPTFRVVLRGLPTGEVSATGGGGGAGRVRDYGKDRTPSTRLAAFFATAAAHFRDEYADAPLLLKSRSMLLENFVVCQGIPADAERDLNSSVHLTRQSTSRNDDGAFYYTTGSIRLDDDGPGGSFRSSSKPHGTPTLHTSSLVVVSPVPTLMSPSMFGAAPLLRPTGATSHNTSILATARPVSSFASPRGGGRSGAASPNPMASAGRAVAAVATHRHPVQRRRPWMREGNDLEERPFYELLVHRCSVIREAITAAQVASSAYEPGRPLQCSAPYIPHYHHPFNNTHNDPRFFVDSERQERLQEAARRAAATAAAAAAVRASGSGSSAFQDAEQRRSSPPPPVPPLHFRATDFVFGLQTARDEQAALESEAAVLRERAGEIWEALRKSVKHYNQLQVELRQRAAKRSGGSGGLNGGGGGGCSASPPPLPPPRQIILEY